MSTPRVITPEQWLAGVPLQTSATLFFLGADVDGIRYALARRGWQGRVIHLGPPHFDGLDRVAASLEADAEQPVVALEPGVARTHRQAVTAAARSIGRAWFGARANQEARRQNAGRYLLNTLRNLDTIATEGDAAALANVFAGRPAMVVAAGPSLDDNIADILAMRDRAVVVAVDTALRPLLSAGIHPDFVVAADPTEANARHLVELPPCPSTYLVAEGSIDPEAFRHFAGRTFIFNVADHHPWPWLRAEGIERARLRSWGSVLTTAYDFALQLGSDPIVFAGADLAFSDGRPYARGTTYDEEWQRSEAWGERLPDVWAAQLAQWPETFEPGVDGRAVRTAPHLRSFRDWLVEAAAASGTTTVNATPRGILLGPGITQRPLADVLASAPADHATVRAMIEACYRAAARPATAVPALPAHGVREAWRAFASVSDTQIEAMRCRYSDQASAIACPPPVAEPTPAERDAAYLDALSKVGTIRLVRLTDASMDLLAALRTASHQLERQMSVVVIDELDRSVGAQARQAIDGLLAERPDLWVYYRRFEDRQSRVSVIRAFTADSAPVIDSADAAKWSPDHLATAQSLATVIHRHLQPTSVFDIGCGSGAWLDAFRSLGVEQVRGVSSREESFLDLSDAQRADVCLCIEVAHGVPWDSQDALIERCVRASDTVIFSSRPPGAQPGPTYERPLPHWAAKFWKHGYVLDDDLRTLLEHQFDFPRNAFDFLMVFRRRFTAAHVQDPSISNWVVGLAARLYEMQVQRSWWLIQAYDGRGALAQREAPSRRATVWTIPAARLLVSPAGGRVFRFRSDAARWYLSHPGSALQVLEDGAILSSWTRWRDEVTLTATDGSDPRTNGRRYSLVLPEHVAHAEAQPFVRCPE